MEVLLLVAGGILVLSGWLIGYQTCLSRDRRCDSFLQELPEPDLPPDLIHGWNPADYRCLRRQGHEGDHQYGSPVHDWVYLTP